ncbi:MAG: hypothetical protein ACI3XA_10320 [Clostridia bacterium]
MNNNTKIIISAIIMAVVVSLLFIVVPITDTFIVSYIFTLIAIIGIALSLCVFGKRETTKTPQGHAFVYTAVIYSIISVFFSVIACLISLYVLWTLVIHIAVLAVFIIRIIAITAGSEYINEVDSKAEQKHKEFIKEKENYWR